MTALRQILIPLTFFTFAAFGLSAQQNFDDEPVILADAGDSNSKKSRPKYPLPIQKQKEVIPDYYRHHKKLPAGYQGFVIELTTSDMPLKRNYFLFDQFGNVFYDQLRKGDYAYCILINFSKRKAVKKFLNNIILPKAPEARLVEYKNGKRKYK